MARLSENAVRRLKAGEELRDPALRGFGVRAQRTGATWFLAYQLPDGRRRRLRLGTYPATGLQEARRRAFEARAELEQGRDPAVSEKAATLCKAFERYRGLELARFRAGPAMAEDIRRDVITRLGERPLSDITRSDLARVLDDIEARAPVQANRVLQYTKAMFRRFVERGLLEASPAAALRKRTRELPRGRVLATEELAALWAACELEGSWFGPLVQLLMLTGMRRGEPLAAKVEAGTLGKPTRLTVAATKQGTAHVIVLPPQAVGPALRFYEDSERPSSAHVPGWSKRWPRLLQLAGLPRGAFRIHDLRRTWATTAARIGVDPFIIELCLGHAPGGVLGRVGAIYNRHSYIDRCAEAWQRVADYLETELGAGKPQVP